MPATSQSQKLIFSVGSELKLGSAWFWQIRIGSAQLAMPSKELGLACHILQKKFDSAWLALSFKKPSYFEKQKMS